MKLTKTTTLLLVIVIAALFWTFSNLSKLRGAKQNNGISNSSLTKSQGTDVSQDTILVKGFNYGYSPKEIRIKQGETVKLRLTSDDSPHTFTIDELGVNQEFTWGKDTDVSFSASKKGTFQFYCAVPGHKESGMVGTLIVE